MRIESSDGGNRLHVIRDLRIFICDKVKIDLHILDEFRHGLENMAGGEGGDDSFSDSVEISDELSAAHGINSFVDVGGNFGFSGLFRGRKIDSATILGDVEFEECGESFDGFGVDDGL